MKISLNEVFEINVIEALTYTDYLTKKADYDRLRLKQL